jgi:hypothetical protein
VVYHGLSRGVVGQSFLICCQALPSLLPVISLTFSFCFMT